MRLTMFRTKLLLFGAVFLILIITMGGLALWVAKQTSYHLERSRLSNAVNSDYLRLSAQTQTLFKQLIDRVLTGDLADQFETRSVQLDMVPTLDAIRQEIASEVALVAAEKAERELIQSLE